MSQTLSPRQERILIGIYAELKIYNYYKGMETQTRIGNNQQIEVEKLRKEKYKEAIDFIDED